MKPSIVRTLLRKINITTKIRIRIMIITISKRKNNFTWILLSLFLIIANDLNALQAADDKLSEVKNSEVMDKSVSKETVIYKKLTAKDPYPLKKCEQGGIKYGGHPVPFDKDGKFLPECAPKYLYAWHSEQGIEDFKSGMNSFDLLSIGNYRNKKYNIINMGFSATQTSIGSFGYNDHCMRLKLKDGVKFKFINDPYNRDCSSYEYKDKETTVYVLNLLNRFDLPVNVLDYYLCDSGPIESWSHSTPEALAEMKAERDHIEKYINTYGTNDMNYACYFKPSSTDKSLWNWVDNLVSDKSRKPFLGFVIDSENDGDNWRKDYLDKSIERMEKEIAGGSMGEIFYARGVSHDRKSHFTPLNVLYNNADTTH